MLKPHSSITATHCTPLLGVPEYKSDAGLRLMMRMMISPMNDFEILQTVRFFLNVWTNTSNCWGLSSLAMDIIRGLSL